MGLRHSPRMEGFAVTFKSEHQRWCRKVYVEFFVLVRNLYFVIMFEVTKSQFSKEFKELAFQPRHMFWCPLYLIQIMVTSNIARYSCPIDLVPWASPPSVTGCAQYVML